MCRQSRINYLTVTMPHWKPVDIVRKGKCSGDGRCPVGHLPRSLSDVVSVSPGWQYEGEGNRKGGIAMQKKMVLAIVGFVALSMMLSGTASAQQPFPLAPQPPQPAQMQTPAQTGQYPNVSNLKPFSQEADFMSLAGYLRYLVYQQSSQWLTRGEAVRVVRQQGAN